MQSLLNFFASSQFSQLYAQFAVQLASICLHDFYQLFQIMSFERFKSFWKGKQSNTHNNQSLILKTQHFISNTWNRTHDYQQSKSTSEFDDFLASLPQRKKPHQKRNASDRTLKPQRIQRCLNKINREFLDPNYKIRNHLFDRKKKIILQKQATMQDQLDQIEMCLFNQVSNKFDEILSVVRTIESLEFLVQDNQVKLREVRSQNLSNIMQVTEKQRKIIRIQQKINNMTRVKLIAEKLKQYKDITYANSNVGDSVVYARIEAIRSEKEDISKLVAGSKFDENIQNVEDTLKRSFCIKFNQSLFSYVSAQYAYRTQFWNKFIGKSNIFEEKTVLQGTTVLLDDSVMGEQEMVVLVKGDREQEQRLLLCLRDGWKQSEYDTHQIHEQIKKFIINNYLLFIQDFRNLCDQACTNSGLSIDNPSLANLLSEMCAKFCSRAFNYYVDLHKSILLRIFTVILNFFQLNKNVETNKKLSVSEKEQMKIFREGFIDLLSHTCRIFTSKLSELIQMKYIHEAMDIIEFKEVVSAFRNYEQFVEKSFLIPIRQFPIDEWFCDKNEQFQDLVCVSTTKQKVQGKIRAYLAHMHHNVINEELKQKLKEEKWVSTDIPTYYYDSLHFLLTGECLNLRRNKNLGTSFMKNNHKSITYETSVLMESFYIDACSKREEPKILGDFRIIRNDIYIKGKSYKITETVLVVIQVIEDYMAIVHNFPSIQREVGNKINEFLRAYNSSSCELIVNKGAIQFKAFDSKSIKAKHLALSSVCLSFILTILDSISKRVEIHDLQKLRESYLEHISKINGILNQMISKVAKKSIAKINLKNTPSEGTQSIVSNTKILYEILSEFYDKNSLSRVFTSQIISSYLQGVNSIKVENRMQAQSLKSDIGFFFEQLEFLEESVIEFSDQRIKAQQKIRQIFENL